MAADKTNFTSPSGMIAIIGKLNWPQAAISKATTCCVLSQAQPKIVVGVAKLIQGALTSLTGMVAFAT